MDALTSVVGFLDTVISVLRPAVFVAAVATVAAATASWAVRTRRIGPFSAFARLTRHSIDPLFLPAQRRVVRFGGVPAQAPWWTVGAVVIGGLIVLAALQFVRDQMVLLSMNTYAGPRGILMVVVSWAFMLLKVALIARVISTWVGGSPYSPWWRWSYALSEPLLAPLRRVLPTFGALDLSPLVAYFGLTLLQSLVEGVIQH